MLHLILGVSLNGSAPKHNNYPDISSHSRSLPSHFHSKHFLRNAHSVFAITKHHPDNLRTLPTLDRSVFCPVVGISKHPLLIEKHAIFRKDFFPLEESKSREIEKTKPKRSCSRFFKWLVSFFDLTIFLDAGFIVICASCVIAQLAHFVPFTYFFHFATKQAGLAENSALLLVTITGILHTLGRFVGGMMANVPGVDIIIVMAISCILCAICHFALPFLPHAFTALALYCSGFGFFCGKFFTCYIDI